MDVWGRVHHTNFVGIFISLGPFQQQAGYATPMYRQGNKGVNTRREEGKRLDCNFVI
jgi:hypothetical protein